MLFILPAIFFSVMMLSYWILSRRTRRTNLHHRLQFSQKKNHGHGFLKPEGTKKKKSLLTDEFIENFKKKNKQTIADFRVRFERCGWDPYSAAILVPIYKISSMVLFVILFFVLNYTVGNFAALNPLMKYSLLALFLFIGYRGFDYVTDLKMAYRQNLIVNDIPMAIDLLVVCVRGGLSFDNALERIAQEIIHTNPDLARELTITSAELGILPERKLAYTNLARRVGSELMQTLTTSLIQAEEQGVAIGKTLMFLSHESAKQKLMMIERHASKLPAKLTVPVILLSLPAILIIILGPTISAIMESNLFG